MRRILTFLTVLASASLALHAQSGAPDVVIVNARIFTGLTARPCGFCRPVKREVRPTPTKDKSLPTESQTARDREP